MNPSDITAFILTRDEERDLPRAISSLPHGVSILVLDAVSTDRTVAYAIASGARVIERRWTDFVDARRYGLAQVATPWVLMLDADEELDDRLRDAIVAAPDDVDGYVMRRTTYFRGKPMRIWSDEPLLRLVRTGAARIDNSLVHERMICDGDVRELRGTLLHYSYPSARSYREKYARYTAIEALAQRANPLRWLGETALVAPRFANHLLRRGALLDGPRGWYVAWYSALYPAVVAGKAIRQTWSDRKRS
ncbi:MAG TPA: glycosyltransferase family 2 protein [Candidatus Acidoferrum sp.]|nr:glycosyltransferase family 2 protein [Candidatus Acidoferrum sp.]